MVPPPAEVLAHQPGDRALVHVFQGRSTLGQRFDPAAKFAAEPALQRDGKALLRFLEYDVGHEAPDCLPEDPLPGAVAQLQVPGERGRELDQRMVKQGNPGLQGDRHARALETSRIGVAMLVRSTLVRISPGR